jgi:hypothetical protein
MMLMPRHMPPGTDVPAGVTDVRRRPAEHVCPAPAHTRQVTPDNLRP